MNTKICSKCKKAKCLNEFYVRRGAKYADDARRSECKECGLRAVIEWKSTPAGKASTEKYKKSEKGKAARQEYYKKNKEKFKEYNKQYRIKNKDILAKKREQWYSENRDEILAKRRLWNLTPEGRYKQYKYKAKERGLSFELSFEEFCNLWKKPCTYCGASIDTIGIDRVDNNIGYNIKNIVSCCSSCNTKKGQMTCEQWNRILKKETKNDTKSL
tara:strand:- start:2981 stop:3625 length:645 start_codon:yes stop_codon:yes gene_type:complete